MYGCYHGFGGGVWSLVRDWQIGVDIGPPRPPLAALPQSQWAALHAALDAYGFW